jgi:predicted Fe-Mo cluster-binding NifX family protein/predicted DNA-binding protein (UPF0251 family)
MKLVGISPCAREEVALGLDEAKELRLADLAGLYQEAAARSMSVSRPIFSCIVEVARHKVADADISGKTLRIEGGEITIREQGETIMKIAVPSRDGNVDEHFGHCKEFLIFRVEGEKLVEEQSIPSLEGCGCKSGVASTLAHSGVTHLVAGNMGEGAVRVLNAQGIEVARGASGPAKAAAEAFAKGAFIDAGIGCVGHGESGHECSQ